MSVPGKITGPCQAAGHRGQVDAAGRKIREGRGTLYPLRDCGAAPFVRVCSAQHTTQRRRAAAAAAGAGKKGAG